MPATLVFWQHHTREEEEFESFDKALDHAAYLSAYFLGAPEAIVDGARTVDGDALSEMIYARERERGLA